MKKSNKSNALAWIVGGLLLLGLGWLIKSKIDEKKKSPAKKDAEHPPVSSSR